MLKEISITISNQHHCLYFVILFFFSLGDVVILTSMCVSYQSEIEHELYKVNYINIDI
jgi:hypothetical protein